MAQTQDDIKKTSSKDLLTCGNGKGETFFEKERKKEKVSISCFNLFTERISVYQINPETLIICD